MIKYKCAHCGAKLETDDSLSGKQEVCPKCLKPNRVPLSEHDKAESKARARAAHEEIDRQLAIKAKADEQKMLATWEEGRRKWQAAGDRVDAMKSWTESALGVLGAICVGIGAAGAVVGLVMSAVHDAPALFLYGLAFLAGGFLWGIPLFAAQLVLRYLRKIMKAVQGDK